MNTKALSALLALLAVAARAGECPGPQTLGDFMDGELKVSVCTKADGTPLGASYCYSNSGNCVHREMWRWVPAEAFAEEGFPLSRRAESVSIPARLNLLQSAETRAYLAQAKALAVRARPLPRPRCEDETRHVVGAVKGPVVQGPWAIVECWSRGRPEGVYLVESGRDTIWLDVAALKRHKLYLGGAPEKFWGTQLIVDELPPSRLEMTDEITFQRLRALRAEDRALARARRALSGRPGLP